MAGVPSLTTPADELDEPDRIVGRLVSAAAKRETIAREVRRLESQRIGAVLESSAQFRQKLRPAIVKGISKVPPGLRESAGFLRPGESLEEKSAALIEYGLRERVNAPDKRARVVGFAALSQTDQDVLTQAGLAAGPGVFRDVPDDRIEPMLFRAGENGRSSFLLRENPLDQVCRERSHVEKQDEALLGLSGGQPSNGGAQPPITPGSDTTGNGVVPSMDGRVPVYAARLMDRMTSPEEPVAFGVTQPGTRPNQAAVQESVDSFRLRTGPADTPAIYDFHVLQVAFEHVWREAIDEGVLDVAEDAFRESVELGGDPFDGVGDVIADPVRPIRAFLLAAKLARSDDVPTEVVRAFELSLEQWRVLNREQRDELRRLAVGALDYQIAFDFAGMELGPQVSLHARARFREEGERMLRYADALIESRDGSYHRLHKLLAELDRRLQEPYAFTTFAVEGAQRSINFGLLLDYRAQMVPVAYQVGRLEKTVTLTPGERQLLRKKVVRKVSRSVEEITNSLQTRRTEAAETSRAETEIIAKALNKTNFSLSAEGGYQSAVWNASGSMSFSKEASAESSEIKKSFSEAVFKAAEEYKSERTIKLNTTEAEEAEAEETSELRNPNDEIPVTFLFYELQRRYRMNESLHRVTPVVLVAEEVPRPEQITRAWLVRHDAVLSKAILDRSYLPALNYLSTQVVGDEVALEEMRKNVLQQRRLTGSIEEELVAIREQVGRRYAALERSIEERADVLAGESAEGFGEKAGEWLFGSANDESVEAARIREDAARDAYEREAKLGKEARARLEREVTALNAMTEAYTKALSTHLNRVAQVDRLANHVKDNILYYMQAIWSSEVSDQRSLRLQKVQVPQLKGQKTYTLREVSAGPLGVGLPHRLKDRTIFEVSAESVDVNAAGGTLETVDLVEVADLDNLLGFKWNYLIFPLKQSNALTDFMMTPYADAELGLRDPDEFGNWTLEEFGEYVSCLHEHLPAEEFEAVKGELREQYKRLLTAPHRPNEEIVLPSDSLYIEALPGAHPVLEDFKLLHRALDVKSAQADARTKELENVRLAARLLSTPQLLEDPTIERKIVVEGDASGIVVPPDQ